MNELTAEYLANGITYKSNNESVITRDTAGNIQVNNTVSDILIIEPVTPKITMQSALRVIDTQFNYYTFPVSTTINTSIEEFTIDDTLDLTSATNSDIIYAMYQPKSGTLPLPGGAEESGIDMSVVLEGLPQQFTNQYFISDDIKQSGKDLRIRAKLTHTFSSVDGTIYWWLSLNGFRGSSKKWKGAFTGLPQGSGPGFVKKGNDIITFIDITILNSELLAGDKISIAVSTGQNGHSLKGDASYWSITDASKNVDIWNNEIA